jgi:AcrR family transcriptional regulator
MENARNLQRGDWIRAARLSLRRGGIGAVNVEKLARQMRVSKGSFYWHFKDLADLKECLLAEWEQETEEILVHSDLLPDGRERILRALDYIANIGPGALSGNLPSDAAIFSWARTDKKVAKRVAVVEERRIAFLKRAFLDSGLPEAEASTRAEMGYTLWVGFIARQTRSSSTALNYERIAHELFHTLFPSLQNLEVKS